jgi:hypothetical protein
MNICGQLITVRVNVTVFLSRLENLTIYMWTNFVFDKMLDLYLINRISVLIV